MGLSQKGGFNIGIGTTNMEDDILKKFEEQDKKLGDICKSIEQMKKYFLWTLIITVVMIVLPLIGLAVAIPQFLSTYSQAMNF
jgi:hypothetical protein